MSFKYDDINCLLFVKSSVAFQIERLEKQISVLQRDKARNDYHTRDIPDARERGCDKFDWQVDKLPRATVC